ncbi:hypothetical protein [Erysiphe necator associated tombus-like virus 5]|nr:hypothetical protein [Erysiphe necator associated tombus-like virus 5]
MAKTKIQATKAIQMRKNQPRKTQPKAPKRQTQFVVAPLTRAVRATVPSNLNRRQEEVIEVKAHQAGTSALEFVIHPSNIPWLSGIAPSFQKWGLQGLRVWYEPRVSTSTSGTVSMAVLSDFKDATPLSLKSLTSLKGATRGAPWDKFTLSCPKYRLYEYASDFQSLPTEDKNDRALGRIVVIADMDSSFPVGDVIGRIYLEYTPVLIDPIDPTLQGASA